MTTPNVEIRVYARFSEIRSRVQSDAGTLKLAYSKQTWSAIRESSITLLHLPYASRTITPQESWLTAFEGRQVQVRLPGGVEEVTLVRADDLLVQDANGSYYRAQADQLLLPEAPPRYGQQGMVELKFDLPQAGEGILSYTTEALTWSAGYALDLTEDGATLTAHASLHNHSPEPFEPDVVTLIAGEARERRLQSHSWLGAIQENYQAEPRSTRWEEDGELTGFYRYVLHHPPRIAGGSVVTVPFEDIPLTAATQTTVLETRFESSGVQQGVFQRECRLQAERPLLAASLTLREQGYLIGEQRITETAPGTEVTFTLGRDPNVTWRREAQVTRTETLPRSANEDDEDPETRIQATAQVTYHLRNASKRPVDFTVTERIWHDFTVQGDAQDQGGNIVVKGMLGPGEERTVQFEVVYVTVK